MGDFYVTLPSDASMDVFPNNAVTSYNTRLARALNLEGEWEVALTEITYSTTWTNVTSDERWFRVKIYDETWQAYIPTGL